MPKYVTLRLPRLSISEFITEVFAENYVDPNVIAQITKAAFSPRPQQEVETIPPPAYEDLIKQYALGGMAAVATANEQAAADEEFARQVALRTPNVKDETADDQRLTLLDLTDATRPNVLGRVRTRTAGLFAGGSSSRLSLPLVQTPFVAEPPQEKFATAEPDTPLIDDKCVEQISNLEGYLTRNTAAPPEVIRGLDPSVRNWYAGELNKIMKDEPDRFNEIKNSAEWLKERN